MARRYTQPAPNFQGGQQINNHNRPAAAQQRDRLHTNPPNTQFFEADKPKLGINEFLGVVLQKVHPALFQFWQRHLMQDLEQRGEPSKVWYA